MAQLGHYKNRERLHADVHNLLQNIRTLKPRVRSFQTPDGAGLMLFYLGGTMPIEYKGSSYSSGAVLELELDVSLCFVVFGHAPAQPSFDHELLICLPASINQSNSTINKPQARGTTSR